MGFVIDPVSFPRPLSVSVHPFATRNHSCCTKVKSICNLLVSVWNREIYTLSWNGDVVLHRCLDHVMLLNAVLIGTIFSNSRFVVAWYVCSCCHLKNNSWSRYYTYVGYVGTYGVGTSMLIVRSSCHTFIDVESFMFIGVYVQGAYVMMDIYIHSWLGCREYTNFIY